MTLPLSYTIDLAPGNPNLSAISTDPRAPGLADAVAGDCAFGDIITRDKLSRLHLVAGGATFAAFPLWYATLFSGYYLALFLLLIRTRDRDALLHYARLCIDNIYPRIRNYFCPTLTTISLVQGDALGGGFEMALCGDVIVAEESAMLGLPEILFNLFPGMGAYSLLARRTSPRVAEELILSGKLLPAAKLHEMGIVDVLARNGEGEAAVQNWIARNARRRSGFQAVMRVRQQVNPITRDELDAIADTWVDCALRLEDRDLRMMGRVVRAQQERMEAASAARQSPPPAEIGRAHV